MGGAGSDSAESEDQGNFKKMIIIQLAGGLGNQMFQYALYLQLKSLGRDVRIDDVAGFVQDAKRDPALKPFGISYERASKKEIIKMLDSSLLPWNRVRRKLCGRKKKSYFEEDKRYHPEIMTWDDIYLEGYWQTEKYFEAIADEVRQAYDTDKLVQYLRGAGSTYAVKKSSAHSNEAISGRMSMEDWLARITSTESVSVHIRRGDYLLPENQTLFGGICTEAYYRKAMEQMKRKHPGCRFYLFSNDKKWIKERIEEYKSSCIQKTGAEAAGSDWTDRLEVVDLEEQNDYAEFVLMSKCKHNILANSSFSWWASYLNYNPDRTVFAPDRWLNGWDCRDFYRKDMKGISNT